MATRPRDPLAALGSDQVLSSRRTHQRNEARTLSTPAKGVQLKIPKIGRIAWPSLGYWWPRLT